MADLSTQEVLELLQRAAAEYVTPRFRALADGEVSEKKPGDYVTIADREAEVALTAQLRDAYPQALIVGEEAVPKNPDLLDALPSADHGFLIDPVDGTKNFVHGKPDHAVMMAEVRQGEAVRAWIWQPEHKVALVAERGAGVWRNGERLGSVASRGTPRMATSIRRLRDLESPLLAGPVQRTWLCCGVDYPNLLTGEIDALVYGPPKPWDHVPGTLMLRELGGVARMIDGSEYRPASYEQRLIVACNEQGWHDVYQAAFG